MVKVEGNAITLTRGDTLVRNVIIYDTDGNVYTPKEGYVSQGRQHASVQGSLHLGAYSIRRFQNA